jgi:hypothetical protein
LTRSSDVDFATLEPNYIALVVEAAYGLRRDGMVDIETATQADELGYSITQLTADAEVYRKEILNNQGYA